MKNVLQKLLGLDLLRSKLLTPPRQTVPSADEVCCSSTVVFMASFHRPRGNKMGCTGTRKYIKNHYNLFPALMKLASMMVVVARC